MLNKDFEADLFATGFLEIDPDSYLKDQTEFLNRTLVAFENRNGAGKKDGAEQVIKRLIELEKQKLPWYLRFKGEVPASWENSFAVRNTFELAAGMGVKISRNLLDAGITYPDSTILGTVASGQRLDRFQMAVVYLTPMPYENRLDMEKAQIKFLGEEQALWTMDRARRLQMDWLTGMLDRGTTGVINNRFVPEYLTRGKKRK